MSNKVEIEIQLDQKEPFIKGEQISGHIIINPKEDLDVEYFSYQVLFEQRGLASTEIKNIKHITPLENNKSLSISETYSYPINFKVVNQETYKGKNIELLIKIEATIKLKNNLSSNIILSKIGVMSQGETIIAKRYINIVSKKGSYQLVSSKIDLHSNAFIKKIILFLITISIISSVGILFADNIQQKHKGIIASLVLIPILLIILYNLLEFILIGKIKATLKDIENDKFNININNDLNWKFIKKAISSYSICEEVIDRRGTTDSSEIAYIHKSEPIEFINPEQDINMTFSYPNNKLATYQQDDLRISWSIELKIISLLGISFTFRNEFDVKRINQPQ